MASMHRQACDPDDALAMHKVVFAHGALYLHSLLLRTNQEVAPQAGPRTRRILLRHVCHDLHEPAFASLGAPSKAGCKRAETRQQGKGGGGVGVGAAANCHNAEFVSRAHPSAEER